MNDQNGRPDPIAGARDEVAEPGVVPAAAESAPGERSSDLVGRYKLLQQIGEGGMGTVWMAEQQEPVTRRVALKIIKLGMDTREVVARFEAERQALALMDHPHIAKVLDGGATEGGRPYFVMELVRGVPITEYCDRAKLGLRARLELFAQVCQAIQHAHQKGIIHRDVKPSNVLVTLHDGVPVPKVIDFGIAKATDVTLTRKTLFTRFEQMIGTPEYMSPEQAEMSGLDVDTRTDVYSLGVLLYELLTGTKPFDLQTVLERGYAELMRTIREIEPDRPSTRVSTFGKNASPVGADRALDAEGLSKRLRGDLDWIVMKALEKDRTRRYETASGFAADIRRYLEDEPVIARPPSRAYRISKLIRRNRKSVLAAAAIVLLLIAGAVGATWAWLHVREVNEQLAAALEEQARQSERAERSAEATRHQLARTVEVKRLLEEMLRGVEPQVALGLDTQLLETILASFVERLEAGEVEDEAVAAELHIVIGGIYKDLHEFDRAARHYQTALASTIRMWGEAHFGSLSARLHLAGLRLMQTRDQDVLDLIEPYLPLWEATHGPEDEATLQARVAVAQALVNLGERARAERILRSVLEIRSRTVGVGDPSYAHTEAELGTLLYNGQEQFDEVLTIRRRQVAWTRERFGEEHVKTIDAETRLAMIYHALERYDEAIDVLEETVAKSNALLGSEYVHTLQAELQLAATLEALGRHEDARDRYEVVVDKGERVLGPAHGLVRSARVAFGNFSKDRMDLATARRLLEANVSLEDVPEDETQIESKFALLDVCANLGEFERVTSLYEESRPAIEARVAAMREPGHRIRDDERLLIRCLTNTGYCYAARERFAEARPFLEISQPLAKLHLGLAHPWTAVATRQLAQALDGLGETETAIAVWRDFNACLIAGCDAIPPPPPEQLNQVAWMLMRPPHDELRDDATALRLAELALDRSEAKNPRIVATAVEARVRAGDLEGAVAALEAVIPLMESEPAEARAMFAARLEELKAELAAR